MRGGEEFILHVNSEGKQRGGRGGPVYLSTAKRELNRMPEMPFRSSISYAYCSGALPLMSSAKLVGGEHVCVCDQNNGCVHRHLAL